MHRNDMLTESRKRRRDAEELQVLPQAKRSGGSGGYSFLPEVGRDVWDSESSSSESSGISSPERMAGATSSIQKTDQRGLHVSQAPCSPIAPVIAAEEPAVSLSHSVSYDHINRILREAHFSSLQTRGQQGPT